MHLSLDYAHKFARLVVRCSAVFHSFLLFFLFVSVFWYALSCCCSCHATCKALVLLLRLRECFCPLLPLVLREIQTLLVAKMWKLITSYKEIGPKLVMKFDHRRCREVKLCNMHFFSQNTVRKIIMYSSASHLEGCFHWFKMWSNTLKHELQLGGYFRWLTATS